MYDSIKKAFEETNPAPSFPVETDYNMYYAYRSGVCLGKFASLDDANKTNPACIETYKDHDKFDQMKIEYINYQIDAHEFVINFLRNTDTR